MVRLLSARLSLLILAAASATAFGSPQWRPFTKEDLSDSKPALVEGAPAEVLFWSISVDDIDYPQSRLVKEYLRYKIYDPARALNLTRLSEMSASLDGEQLMLDSDIHARLILPDGTVKEFGNEAIQSRTVQHQGDDGFFGRILGLSSDISQKFLAVPGIVPGSILEFETENRINTIFVGTRAFMRVLQKHDIGVRHVEYSLRFASNDYAPVPFVRNGENYHAVVKYKRGSLLSVTAENLPALYREPYSPPELDRALAVDGSYVELSARLLTHHGSDGFGSGAVNSMGPWGALSTRSAMIENDVIGDGLEQDTADRLTKGAAGELEKAERIHRFVHDLYLRWRAAPKPKVGHSSYYSAVLPEELLYFEKYPDSVVQLSDFSILALGLYRAAGLKADSILLPNNNYSTFTQQMVSDHLLPDRCVRVLIEGKWMYSEPQLTRPLAFGSLPAANRGTVGLVVNLRKAEFVEIPEANAAESVVKNEADLTLSLDGRLSGMCKQTLTGEFAYELRPGGLTVDQRRVKRQWARRLRTELKADELTVTDVSGVGDPDQPLMVTYSVGWNNYAEVTKSHLIFVQSVFGSRANPMLTAQTRHNDILFPFHYGQSDDLKIQLPTGCTLESPSAPVSQRGGVISIVFNVTYDKAQNIIHLKREFASNLGFVPVERYSALKHWFDTVSQSENHELVLIKPASAAPEVPVAQPSTPAPEVNPDDKSS